MTKKRITHYRHTYYSVVDGTLYEDVLEFKEHHARETSANLHNGIPLESAEYLISQWNASCRKTSIYALVQPIVL